MVLTTALLSKAPQQQARSWYALQRPRQRDHVALRPWAQRPWAQRRSPRLLARPAVPSHASRTCVGQQEIRKRNGEAPPTASIHRTTANFLPALLCKVASSTRQTLLGLPPPLRLNQIKRHVLVNFQYEHALECLSSA